MTLVLHTRITHSYYTLVLLSRSYKCHITHVYTWYRVTDVGHDFLRKNTANFDTNSTTSGRLQSKNNWQHWNQSFLDRLVIYLQHLDTVLFPTKRMILSLRCQKVFFHECFLSCDISNVIRAKLNWENIISSFQMWLNWKLPSISILVRLLAIMSRHHFLIASVITFCDYI